MFGIQVFPHLSQSDTKPEHGYQIKGADLGTEPGKWCNWFNSISIQRYEWLERHGGTGTEERIRKLSAPEALKGLSKAEHRFIILTVRWRPAQY
jgi:hypothetical protein